MPQSLNFETTSGLKIMSHELTGASGIAALILSTSDCESLLPLA